MNKTWGIRQYFNIPELIVVVSVCMGLFTFILPTIYQAATHVRTTSCKGNLAKIGVAVTSYTVQTKGFLPPWNKGWVAAVAKAGNLKVDQNQLPAGIWRCPSQPPVALGNVSASEWWRGSNYGLNMHLSYPVTTPDSHVPYRAWSLVNIKKLRDPATKCLIADATGSNPLGIPNTDPVVSGYSFKAGNFAGCLPPNPVIGMPYLRHQGGCANFLFADQHVETLSGFPNLMLGPGTRGYAFWHPEHYSPLSGIPGAKGKTPATRKTGTAQPKKTSTDAVPKK